MSEPKRSAESVINRINELEGSTVINSSVIIDASDIEPDRLLYYVYNGTPVVVRTDTGTPMLIYSYDRDNISILYPSDEPEGDVTRTMSKTEAEEYLKEYDNDYICIVPY